jgi:hypothetical protein
LFVEENAYRACVFPFIFQRSVYTGCTLRQVEELVKCHVPDPHVFCHSSTSYDSGLLLVLLDLTLKKEVYGTVSLKDIASFLLIWKGKSRKMNIFSKVSCFEPILSANGLLPIGF